MKKLLSFLTLTVIVMPLAFSLTFAITGSVSPVPQALAAAHDITEDQNAVDTQNPDVIFVPTTNTEAEPATKISTTGAFFLRLENMINKVILPFLIGLGVLAIVYGVFGYIAQAGNEEKRAEAKQFIIWSFIGLFIMLSVWGILNILIKSFGTNTAIPSDLPTVPLTTSTIGTTALTNISSVVIQLQKIINLFIPFFVGLGVFFIIYGLVAYIAQAANEEKRKEARGFITWGLVGIFVMLSVWGLVNILIGTLPLNNSYTYQGPLPAAADPGVPDTIPKLLAKMGVVLAGVTPFVLALATFIIIVGAVNYVRQAGNEEKVKEAKGFIVWGIISLFVMISIWGIVNILTGSFKFTNTLQRTQLPTLPTVQ
jgi:uncharacterized protein with PQ loop repeat